MRRCSHSAPHQFGVAAVADAARGEDRRRIARPERFEPFQLAAECGRDLREEQFGVDVHLRNEHLRIDVLFDVGVEPPRELPDVLRPHREPCGVHVPAEVFQQVGARLHGLIEVEARHRTGRTRREAVALRQDDRRPEVGLDQARRDDADDALHPPGIVDDRALAVFQFGRSR